MKNIKPRCDFCSFPTSSIIKLKRSSGLLYNVCPRCSVKYEKMKNVKSKCSCNKKRKNV